MATLTQQVQDVLTGFTANAPPAIRDTINGAKQTALDDFKPEQAIQVGARVPAFSLQNQVGETVSDSSLLAQGKAFLLVFYRGEWCPFCNLALRAYQQRQADFRARGVELVGVSPELPDASLTTHQKNELSFPVLSDAGLQLSRKLGIAWKQPDALRPVFDKMQFNLQQRNGDDSFELPVPSYILVDKTGIVRNTFFDPNWSRRLEPEVALGWADKL